MIISSFLITGLGIVSLFTFETNTHNAQLYFLSQVEFHIYNFRLTPPVYVYQERVYRFLLKRERSRARDREKRQRKKRRSLVSTITFPRVLELFIVYNLHGVQMSLTIVALFETEVLMRFQDIFNQDSALLKFWLVLLLNFINLRGV